MKRVIIFVGVLLTSNLASAENEEDCTTIEDPQARLACFDRRFARSSEVEKAATVEEPGVSESAATAGDQGAPVIASEPIAAEPEAVDAPAASGSKSDKAGLFDQDVKVHLSSTVTHVRSRPQQKMLFQLENDQVWIQSVPRMLQIREGDRVEIENASIGGYMMRTERGVTTRVERIR